MRNTPKVYLVRAGRYGEDEDNVLENNRAIIGFAEIPSLERVEDYDAVAKVVRETLPGRTATSPGSYWRSG